MAATDDLRRIAPALRALAEAGGDREACGFVVRRADGSLEPWPLANVAKEATRAFEMAPGDVLGVMRELEREGAALRAVYHSHPFGGAELSGPDLASRLVQGQPILPALDEVVIALASGRATVVRVHIFDGTTYRGETLWEDEGGSHGA
jgi:proteasome lid subunit RPN8/RPN11